MKLLGSAGLLALLLPFASAFADDGGVSPLGQVISLLENLAAKVQRQADEEQKTYQAFLDWCKTAATDKGHEIKSAKARKEKLEAAIGKYAGEVEAATAKIEELAGSLAGGEADLKSATAVRDKEAGDFRNNEAELMDVINTIGRAVSILERELAKKPAAFAQVDTSNMDKIIQSLSAVVDAASFSAADKKKLLAMVQSQQGAAAAEADDDQELGPPEAAPYKAKSGSIIDVLEDLKEKAEEQLAALRKAEAAAKHNYDMLRQSLEDQMAADNKDLEEEKVGKAASAEGKATSEGELAATVKDLADSQGALELAQGNCMTAASDHEATVKARQEEQEAIRQAMGILQNTTGGAAQSTYSFLQQNQDRSQVQSSLNTRFDLANAEVAALVKKLAQQHHSAALAQLASRISATMRFGAGAGEDPFKKVKELIQDLIQRLQSEQSNEATEKAYCDEQMSKTEEKKGELDFDLSKISSKIDQAVAKSTGLKADVKELQSDLAKLSREQAEMDKIRVEGRKVYTETKADLEMGLSGVRKALGVLREFYSSGSSLMQDSPGGFMQQPAMPESYSKSSGAGSGIISMLEVVESDFAKNLATTEAEEDDAEVEYQKTTQTNKVTKQLKEQDVRHKTAQFQGLDRTIGELTADRETADAELTAVMEYYGKIRERCVAKPESYEERKARREAEVAGLKEALSILEDEGAFVQKGKKASSGRGHFLALLS